MKTKSNTISTYQYNYHPAGANFIGDSVLASKTATKNSYHAIVNLCINDLPDSKYKEEYNDILMFDVRSDIYICLESTCHLEPDFINCIHNRLITTQHEIIIQRIHTYLEVKNNTYTLGRGRNA